MFLFLPPANEVCEGYVFTRVSHSVHRGGGGVWYPSMHCMFLSTGGVVSQHALQVSRPTPRGKVEGSGLGGGLQAHTWGWGWVSQPALRQTPLPPQQTAAEGGMHPTGMHSCFNLLLPTTVVAGR